MRITNKQVVSQALGNLNKVGFELNQINQQLASGRRVTRGSDDPSGASRILALRSDLRSREQENRNADDADTQLALADTALQTMSERLRRVRDLSVSGANLQSSNASNTAFAQEVGQIREELVAIANSRHDGRPVFSGFTDQNAVAQVAGVWTYQGDAGKIERRIGNAEFVEVNVTGDDVFGFTAGADLFTLLDDIEALHNANDQTGLSNSLTDIDGALSRIQNGLGIVGAAGNRIESARDRNLENQLSIRTEISQVQDTDIAETVMELQIHELAYETTLAAVGRTLPTSLVSFLR